MRVSNTVTRRRPISSATQKKRAMDEARSKGLVRMA